MTSFKSDITKLSKGFGELLNNFNDAIANLNSFSSPKTSNDASTSTADLVVTPIPQPQAPLKSKDLLAQSTSANTINDNKKKQDGPSLAKNVNEISKRFCLRSRSETSKNNKASDVDTIVSPPLINTPPSENQVLEVLNPIPKQIESVPKPKVIFVSRLKSDLAPNDIVCHLTSNHCISSNESIIRCSKISKPNAFVSSFKIVVPPDLFESICNPNVWPSGTLIKEFVASPRTSRVSINPISKN